MLEEVIKMRKLLDDRLVKLIDKMGENPYEYYRFEETPMTKLTVDRVENVSNARANVYLEGEIEPYTKFSNSDLELEITGEDARTIGIFLPKMIDENFDIHFYFMLPEGIEHLSYIFYIEEAEQQYYLTSNGDDSEYAIKLTRSSISDGKVYEHFSIEKRNPSTEENITIKKINGIVYVDAAEA